MYARTYRETGHGEVANRGSWPYGEIIIISTYIIMICRTGGAVHRGCSTGEHYIISKQWYSTSDRFPRVEGHCGPISVAVHDRHYALTRWCTYCKLFRRNRSSSSVRLLRYVYFNAQYKIYKKKILWTLYIFISICFNDIYVFKSRTLLCMMVVIGVSCRVRR